MFEQKAIRRKSIVSIILAVFIAGCELNASSYYQRDPKWDFADEVYHNEIGKKVFSRLRLNKKLRPCESGWALLGGDKIRLMHCGFYYYGEMNVEEARDLLLVIANLYLNAINGNERIRPLLEFYPFTPRDIEIRIFLSRPDRVPISPENLHVISMINGKLEYENYAPGTIFLNTLHKETYEEAMSRFAGSRSSTSLENQSSRLLF